MMNVVSGGRGWRAAGITLGCLLLLVVGAVTVIGQIQVRDSERKIASLRTEVMAQKQTITELQGSSNTNSLSSLTTDVNDLHSTLDKIQGTTIPQFNKRLNLICDNKTVTNQISSWNGAQSASGQTWYQELVSALMAACQPYATAGG